MRIAELAFRVLVGTYAPWYADWVMGVPLILLTVTMHVFGLSAITNRKLILTYDKFIERRPYASFVVIMGITTLLATVLHGIEAAVWAEAYCVSGALSDYKSAMLYSMSSMTTYGHESLQLEAPWQLMGAIEALNGWLLFGLTTAVLFATIQKLSTYTRGASQSR